MVVFELSMPNKGSWNGKWSMEKYVHIIKKKNSQVPKDIIGKSFYYSWDDGWTACVSVKKYDSRDKEYKELVKNNSGFCGYDWMVESIIESKEIKIGGIG